MNACYAKANSHPMQDGGQEGVPKEVAPAEARGHLARKVTDVAGRGKEKGGETRLETRLARPRPL